MQTTTVALFLPLLLLLLSPFVVVPTSCDPLVPMTTISIHYDVKDNVVVWWCVPRARDWPVRLPRCLTLRFGSACCCHDGDTQA